MSKSKTTNPIIILAICTAIFIAIFFAFVYWEDARLAQRARGHTRVWTRTRINDLSKAVYLAVSDGAHHPVKMEDLSRYMGSDAQNNIVYDWWGSPILMSYEGNGVYKFVSYGPNQKDDQGRKDDIVEIDDLSYMGRESTEEKQ